jgi:hypothetical protein
MLYVPYESASSGNLRTIHLSIQVLSPVATPCFSTTLFAEMKQSDAIALISNDTIVQYGVVQA